MNPKQFFAELKRRNLQFLQQYARARVLAGENRWHGEMEKQPLGALGLSLLILTEEQLRDAKLYRCFQSWRI